MSMRLDVEFPKPLSVGERRLVAMVVATLAKTDGVRFIHGDRSAVILGEALSARRVRELFTEHGVDVTAINSSLDSDEDARVDDAPETVERERVRAIGR